VKIIEMKKTTFVFFKELIHCPIMKKLISILTITIILSLNFFHCINTQAYQNCNSYDRKYAVIVVGRYMGILNDILPKNFQNYYGWYLNAAKMLYETLRDNYNYKDENIFLLTSFRYGFDIADGFEESWVDFESNKENLQYVLNKFKPGGQIWLKNNDSLLFCYIDHGGDNPKENGKYAHNSHVGFPYEFENIWEAIRVLLLKKDMDKYAIRDWELGEYFENIQAGRIIFLLQPCYSGGFINELSGINHIVCTSSRENETAAQAWIEPFIRGLGGLADSNDDNKISVLEAYEYTARKVSEKTNREHPLIDDNDDGIGHHFSELKYNPFQPNYDGYLAARTYL
jgi:hypothetical protein